MLAKALSVREVGLTYKDPQRPCFSAKVMPMKTSIGQEAKVKKNKKRGGAFGGLAQENPQAIDLGKTPSQT